MTYNLMIDPMISVKFKSMSMSLLSVPIRCNDYNVMSPTQIGFYLLI